MQPSLTIDSILTGNKIKKIKKLVCDTQEKRSFQQFHSIQHTIYSSNVLLEAISTFSFHY